MAEKPQISKKSQQLSLNKVTPLEKMKIYDRSPQRVKKKPNWQCNPNFADTVNQNIMNILIKREKLKEEEKLEKERQEKALKMEALKKKMEFKIYEEARLEKLKSLKRVARQSVSCALVSNIMTTNLSHLTMADLGKKNYSIKQN